LKYAQGLPENSAARGARTRSVPATSTTWPGGSAATAFAPLTATDVITPSSRVTRERHHSSPSPMIAAIAAKMVSRMFMNNPRVP
jgi:hypothetical protein